MSLVLFSELITIYSPHLLSFVAPTILVGVNLGWFLTGYIAYSYPRWQVMYQVSSCISVVMCATHNLIPASPTFLRCSGRYVKGRVFTPSQISNLMYMALQHA